MPALRSPLIAGSAPAGLMLAAAAWLLFRVGGAVTQPLEALDQRLAGLQPRMPWASAAPTDAAARVQAAPLFALTTGPGAVADVSVRLDGLEVTPRRKAALLAINGKPADWLELGASRDGVTLMTVNNDKVEIDTATGFRDVGLGAQPGSTGATSPAGAPASPASSSIPAGIHLPPPPASAPRPVR